MPHARVTAERPGLYTRARRPSAMSLRWNKLNQNVNRFPLNRVWPEVENRRANGPEGNVGTKDRSRYEIFANRSFRCLRFACQIAR